MAHLLIKLTTKRGKILDAFEGDSITREIQAKGEYDGDILDSLTQALALIRPEVSLDVGANIGNHAIVIADHSRRVIAWLKRVYYKFLDRHWVLSSFDPKRCYSNIYLVPSRYRPVFDTLPFMKARVRG